MNELSKGTQIWPCDESFDTRRTRPPLLPPTTRRAASRRCPSNTEVKSDASHQPLEVSGDAPRRVSLSATRRKLK